MTPYDDPRNVKRRSFALYLTIQGSTHHPHDWDVGNQAELDEFRAEIIREFTEHLDACLAYGEWGFEVRSHDATGEK